MKQKGMHRRLNDDQMSDDQNQRAGDKNININELGSSSSGISVEEIKLSY